MATEALPFTLLDLQSALADDVSITELLARGGQKIVFLCTYESRPAVLKLIVETPQSRARAERELEAMLLAHSPHLVTVLSEQICDVRVSDLDYVYFLEEFVEGEDLSDCLGRDWSYADVIRLGRHLISAVEALWRHRIVHRDIKPKNIRIRPSGDAVLLDVGIGRHVDRTDLTTGLAVPGTVGYHSPEQIRRYRSRLDFRSDLFLIGLCMYQIICGVNPFTDGVQDDDEYVRRILECDIMPVRDNDPEVPPALAALLMRLLQPHPHLRPRSFEVAREMLQAAEEEIDGLPDTARLG
jgi:serine/threonine protein kinase